MKTLEFPFYLDAWTYCRTYGIKDYKISKKDFRTWTLSY